MNRNSLFVILIALFACNKGANAQFVAWNFNSSQNGGSVTMSADSIDQHVVVGELTRGSSLTYAPAGINGFWGAEGFSTSSNSEATAISLHNYATFSIKPLTNCTISLTSINPCYIYKSDVGAPTTGRWQYSTDNVNFINIGSSDITWGPNVGNGTSNLQALVDLSTMPALQNVTSATTITFRIVTWGAASSSSDWGFGDVAGNGFQVNLTSTGPASPVIAQWDIFSNTNDFTAPTFSDQNLTLANLSKIIMGPGLSVQSIVQGDYQVNGFTTAPISLSSNAYLQFQITVPVGYSVSLSALDMVVASNLNFDGSPGMKSQWAYTLSGASTVPLTFIGSPDTVILSHVNSGNDNYIYPTVNCSGVANLQNVPAGTTITLRYFVQAVKASYFTISYLNNTIYPSFAHHGIAFRGFVKQGCVSVAAGTISAVRDTICAGNHGILTLSGNTSSAIQWQSSITKGNFANNGVHDTTQYQTDPLSQTTYYRAVVGNTGCVDTSAFIELFVPPALTSYFNFIKSGDTVSFNSDSSVGNIISYYWTFGDGASSNVKNPVHAYSKKDSTYNVCLTIYDGSNCSYTFCKDVIIDLTNGIGMPSIQSQWAIYPNPFNNKLFINGGELNRTIERIEMYDMLGRILMSEDISSGTEHPLKMDVEGLSEGIYFLEIQTKQANFIQQIIKQ